jgi:hypothetical protein
MNSPPHIKGDPRPLIRQDHHSTDMPRAPRYSKNERTLRLELARVSRRLHQSEQKRDAVLERCVEQLTQERNQQTRRARQAEQAARRALELVCEAQAQGQGQAHAHAARQRSLARQSTVGVVACLAGLLQAVLRLFF